MYVDAVLKKIQKGMDVGSTFINIFEELMGRCDVLDLELVAVMAQKIWFRRNGVVHGGNFTHPQQVFREASTSIEDFRRGARTDLTTRSPIHAVSPTLWQSPPIGFFLKLMGMELWIRSRGGLDMTLLLGIIRGLSWVRGALPNNFLVTPKVVEALAALHAVEISKWMGFHDIILEEDALQIVNAIKVTGNIWSNFGHIVDDIKLELRQLRSWRIDHVKRDANTTTHTIAKKAILYVIDRVWVTEIPNYICGIISSHLGSFCL